MAKPTQIKKLEGTYRQDRHLEDEVEYTALSKVPAMPGDLPLEAQNIYQAYCKELVSKKMLYKTDLPSLQVYVFACYQAIEARRKIEENGFVETFHNNKGKVVMVKSPWLLVLESANNTIDKYSKKFGFTPVDKMKIAMPDVKETDPFTEI